MSETDEAKAREEFRTRISSWEAVYHADDDKAARSNKITDEIQRWVDGLGDQVTAILRPLLNDPDSLIRGAAAAYLLTRGATADALATLEEVADGEDLAASRADGVLVWWNATGRNSSIQG